MSLWDSLLVITLTPTAVLVVATYLARKYLDRSFDRDLEQFKNQLQIQSIQYQTRFSSLHQKRAEVIGEFYLRFVRAVSEIGQLVAPLQISTGESLSSRKDRVRECHNKANSYFLEHRLYLDEDLCQDIESAFRLIRESFVEFSIIQPEDEITHGPFNDPQIWKKAHDRIVKEVEPLKRELENRFRSILIPDEV
jgi:parvulin-like peptidyl-prolyl isomerase